MTRAEVIAELTEHLNHWQRLMKEGICGKEYGERTIKSLEFAIDSLKTDEAYQIEYENRDFIEIPEGATNGDVIRSVFPKAYIEEDREDTECVFTNINHGITFDVDWWDEPYRKEQE